MKPPQTNKQHIHILSHKKKKREKKKKNNTFRRGDKRKEKERRESERSQNNQLDLMEFYISRERTGGEERERKRKGEGRFRDKLIDRDI